MAEPLRRRARAGVLRALAAATAGPSDLAVRAVLRSAAEALRWTRLERTARANLELAFGAQLPAREQARILRAVRAHTARIGYEWLRLSRAGRSAAQRERVGRWIDALVEFDASIARLDALARAGRGVLIVTAHLGNWELLAAALHRRGLDGAVVGLQRRNDPSSAWLVELRAGYGVRTLAQDASPREALRVLASGGTLGVLCDLEVTRLAGEFVPFFGRDALTMSAPAALARAARLPLVPVRCVRRGARYVIAVDEPLELRPDLERRAAARDLLTRLNAVFEGWVRATPEQWAWHQKRWSTRPSDDARHRVPLAGRRAQP